MNNQNLNNAKRAKNDEFYTQLSDVEKKLSHYKEFFKGKKVLCNCNDDVWSAFYQYFTDNFNELGLKSLTCITYDKNGKGEKYANGEWSYLNGNGSFDSDESIELLKDADVVVTNPPFSLFRDFVKLLVQYDKKYLIIGNVNAITYKEIFPLIKENKMWIGAVGFKSMTYKTPTEESGCKTLGNTCWFTNIPHSKRNLPMDLYKKYNPKDNPKYDNYDAINVNKTCEIPMDYDGVMGVPITFLGKYCPSQFEIVGGRKGDDGKDLAINGVRPYFRILIKRIK